MARQSADGRWILSASEVGAFTVCEEAWRLRELLRLTRNDDSSRKEGSNAHSRWAKEFDEAQFLRWSIRIILLLILVSIFIYVLSKELS